MHRLDRIYPHFKATVIFIPPPSPPPIDQATELLESMLETWAWTMSRISQTTQTSSQRLNEKYVLVVDTEKKQGMSDSLDSAHPRTSAPRLPGADWFGMQLIAYHSPVLSLEIP